MKQKNVFSGKIFLHALIIWVLFRLTLYTFGIKNPFEKETRDYQNENFVDTCDTHLSMPPETVNF